jgi:hypothetical protein
MAIYQTPENDQPFAKRWKTNSRSFHDDIRYPISGYYQLQMII